MNSKIDFSSNINLAGFLLVKVLSFDFIAVRIVLKVCMASSNISSVKCLWFSGSKIIRKIFEISSVIFDFMNFILNSQDCSHIDLRPLRRSIRLSLDSNTKKLLFLHTSLTHIRIPARVSPDTIFSNSII